MAYELFNRKYMTKAPWVSIVNSGNGRMEIGKVTCRKYGLVPGEYIQICYDGESRRIGFRKCDVGSECSIKINRGGIYWIGVFCLQFQLDIIEIVGRYVTIPSDDESIDFYIQLPDDPEVVTLKSCI